MPEITAQIARVFLPLLQPARYKGAHGGRGSSKSWTFAGMLIRRCLTHPGTFAVCCREIQKSLDQSVKKLLEIVIEQYGVGSKFVVQHDKILTPGGGQIIFQGLQNHTADSIKSLEGYDIAWVEEAQTLSQSSLDLLRPTIRREGSELWFSWNPKSKDNPVDKFLRAETPPGAVVVEANWRDNPWFPEVLRADMEYDRRRDKDKHAHIWEGKYQTNSQSRVFNNWISEEFESPPGGFYRFGADWGYANDPAVLVRARIDGKRLYIDYEAYMVGCEIDQLPDLFDTVPGSRKWFITADSSRPETISYMQKHGYPKISKSAKGSGSVEDGIEFLKSYDIVVHPRCIHTIDELENYAWKIDPLTGEVLPILEDKNNHVIDALRYACEGARKAAKQVRVPVVPAYEPLDVMVGY